MSNEWGRARTLIAHGSLFIALTECKAPAKLPLKSIAAPREPQVRATVVTLQTTLLPQNKMVIHVLAIANGRARSSDEVDSWRLFDLNRDSVTFVDDIAKTYRTESFRSLLAKRREAVIAPLPEGIPAAKLSVTGAKRAILGAQASEVLLRLGGYQRDLWVANHPALPPRLYTLMHLSQPATSPFAPIMKEFDDALLNLRGFALADRAELAYGRSRMIVDTIVVKIEQRDIPESFLNVSSKYQEITPQRPSVMPPPRPRTAS